MEDSRMINFENATLAQGAFYGGNAGAKEGIIYDDTVWMIKYPKTTRDLINPQISYTTSPLSEYLGSKIYELLGLPVHEVLLGKRKNKIVVACKDFTRSDSNKNYPDKMIIPFHDLKNSFMSNDLEEYSGTGSETLLDEVLATIEGESSLSALAGKERFWDMFVVDAFIGNNDRNNGNWGLLINLGGESDELSLTPVYDNGNAFFNKRSLRQMEKRLDDKGLLQDDAYKAPLCVYKYKGLDNEGHQINPFKFIKEGSDENCQAAVQRFLNRIEMQKIKSLINGIPESVGTLAIMPNIQKEFYLELLTIRFEYLKEVASNA